MSNSNPPGQPGIPARWTSSAKSGVGTAISDRSRVWFTISHGILNEVYYPRPDRANTRDLELLVADGAEFFSEEKRDAHSHIRPLAQGVPGYRLINTCRQGRYRIRKTILSDPQRDVVLQRVRFEPLQGGLETYGLYLLLAPHVGNRGAGNDGWVGEHKGLPILFAQRAGLTLGLACSAPFLAMSCGYVGVNDGWTDIHDHKRMEWVYPQALNGNIALTGQIDLLACGGRFVVALGFGYSKSEAGQQVRAALLQDFRRVSRQYVRGWRRFQDRCLDLDAVGRKGFDLYRVSTAVLKAHESKHFSGAIIASLSVPWGASKGDEDLGGYHLVWPRDLVEAAEGLMAAGDLQNARQTLLYLMSTQQPDGHWPQNMWLDGTPYWDGVQMDETASPILLADCVRRQGELKALDPWPMVRKAAAFLVCNGPVTQEDRWEEDGGYSPFTLAVEIAALLAAADFAEQAHETDVAQFLRETADAWNACIEHWTYVTGTEVARQVGVQGYYVRIAPPETSDAPSPAGGFVTIKNRPVEQSAVSSVQIISPDALALVRFGLRAPDDPRIVNTVKVIDALLKTETKSGPVWHRYNQDGYGEHEDGRPFDGTGVGRGWPLLAGERAHYELARGNRAEAERLLQAMAAQTSPGGLLPEQVWDAEDVPERELFNGQPSGSAMPLVWAHAEYIKLLRSIRDGRVFDTPPQTQARYQRSKPVSSYAIWRFNHKRDAIPHGKILRIEVLAPARVHFSMDGWKTAQDLNARDTRLGVHVADLPTAALPAGSTVLFTFYWAQAGRWEGVDFAVQMQ